MRGSLERPNNAAHSDARADAVPILRALMGARRWLRTLGIQGTPVRLTSVDRRTSIEISQAKRGGVHAPYTVRVESAVGGFVGQNDSVHFMDIDGFNAAMKAFLKTRQESVTLRASDDCELEFFRWNTKGDVGVRYVIGTQFMEGEATEYSSIALSGKFKLPGEFAEQMAAQLLETLNA